MIREPAAVLLGLRLLACVPPEFELYPQQFFQVRGPAQLVGLGQVVLDHRPLPSLPRPLEAVSRGVDPGPVGGRDFAHGSHQEMFVGWVTPIKSLFVSIIACCIIFTNSPIFFRFVDPGSAGGRNVAHDLPTSLSVRSRLQTRSTFCVTAAHRIRDAFRPLARNTRLPH